MIRTGMFSKVGDVSFILNGDIIVQSPEPSPKASVKDTFSPEIDELPPETRVAFHRIPTKTLSAGTKAGPVKISLAGKYDEQERTVDHILAAMQQNGILAHLSDEDKKSDDEGDLG